MAALCQRLGDERGDAPAHPHGDYMHQHTRVGMLGTNEEARVAALCQRLGDECGDGPAYPRSDYVHHHTRVSMLGHQ